MTKNAPMVAIIDDDEAVRTSTASFVRSLGYRACAFESAMAFLNRDDREAPDCMIVDVQMPDLSGPDLQERLLAAGHRLPIIFMTAFPTEKDGMRVRAAGAVAYLRKPSGGDELVSSLETALGDRAIR